MTSFGGGFFVVPNEIDFDYIFAHASFEDNLTIYMTILVTLTLYILILIWARYHDNKDEKRLISRPMVDNDPNDHYMYEVLTFTGAKREASCNSKVEVILTGTEDESGVRILDPGWKDTLRKGCVDSYILKVPR